MYFLFELIFHAAYVFIPHTDGEFPQCTCVDSPVSCVCNVCLFRQNLQASGTSKSRRSFGGSRTWWKLCPKTNPCGAQTAVRASNFMFSALFWQISQMHLKLNQCQRSSDRKHDCSKWFGNILLSSIRFSRFQTTVQSAAEWGEADACTHDHYS